MKNSKEKTIISSVYKTDPKMVLFVDSGPNRRKESRRSQNMKMLSIIARVANVRLKRLTRRLKYEKFIKEISSVEARKKDFERHSFIHIFSPATQVYYSMYIEICSWFP